VQCHRNSSSDGNSGKPGIDFARVTARKIAIDTTSAASEPIRPTSASVSLSTVDIANKVSPSHGVCTGLMVLAMPSCPICAIFFRWALLKGTFVAMTPIVVLVVSEGMPPRAHSVTSTNPLPFGDRDPARVCPVFGSMMLPTQFTATRAATQACGSETAFHRKSRLQFSDCCACSCSDTAFGNGSALCGETGLISGLCVGANPWVSQAKVEQNRGRHDRHAGKGRDISDAPLFKVAHDAGGRVQAKRAATGEQDRMRLVDMVDGIEEIGFTCAGPGATNVNTCYRALLAEHNRASCWPSRVGKVADGDSCDIRDESVRLGHYNRMLN
jgi:hypothetical protein